MFWEAKATDTDTKVAHNNSDIPRDHWKIKQTRTHIHDLQHCIKSCVDFIQITLLYVGCIRSSKVLIHLLLIANQ